MSKQFGCAYCDFEADSGDEVWDHFIAKHKDKRDVLRRPAAPSGERQWLKNIRDGISTPDAALKEMEANLLRICSLAAPSQPTSPAPQPNVDKKLDAIDRRNSVVDSMVAAPQPSATAREVAHKILGNGLTSKAYDDVAVIIESFSAREHETGANWMLDNIRASVRGYPDHGGDIEVMQQIERIIARSVAATIANITGRMIEDIMIHKPVYEVADRGDTTDDVDSDKLAAEIRAELAERERARK
jgi:hypothetical protein